MADAIAGFSFPCKHLRSKEMYYQDRPLEEDDYSSGVYWCSRTHETFGPDGREVSRPECKAPRACFED
jgi:hypothetical protein